MFKVFLAFGLSVFFLATRAVAADPFTVAGIEVDATSGDAIAAQTEAIADGQIMAAYQLVERLTLASERSTRGMPTLTSETVAPLIRALEIANERRSNNRYLGEVTISFNRSQVENFLGAQGFNVVSTQARTRLVAPVVSGWSMWAENPWADAWSGAAFTHALTPIRPFTVGEGAGLVSASDVMAKDLDALRRYGQRYGVQQVLIAEASSGPGGITVALTDVSLDSGDKTDLGTVSAATYEGAAEQAVARLENSWKQASALISSRAETMPVTVLYESHADWLQLQDIINGSSQIQDARLEALSRDGAVMTLTFGGDMQRLQNELRYKGAEIRNDPDLGMIVFRRGQF